MEIRTDDFEQEQNVPENKEPKISIEELATLVASKVIEALKTEEKAEEETEEQTEEQPEQNEDEATEDEPTNEEEQPNEGKEEESRSVDYSSFEERLAKLKK